MIIISEVSEIFFPGNKPWFKKRYNGLFLIRNLMNFLISSILLKSTLKSEDLSLPQLIIFSFLLFNLIIFFNSIPIEDVKPVIIIVLILCKIFLYVVPYNWSRIKLST